MLQYLTHPHICGALCATHMTIWHEWKWNSKSWKQRYVQCVIYWFPIGRIYCSADFWHTVIIDKEHGCQMSFSKIGALLTVNKETTSLFICGESLQVNCSFGTGWRDGRGKMEKYGYFGTTWTPDDAKPLIQPVHFFAVFPLPNVF